MNKDKLLAQIEKYEEERDRLLAQANALSGAIRDCEYWLSELEKDQEPKPPVEE